MYRNMRNSRFTGRRSDHYTMILFYVISVISWRYWTFKKIIIKTTFFPVNKITLMYVRHKNEFSILHLCLESIQDPPVYQPFALTSNHDGL